VLTLFVGMPLRRMVAKGDNMGLLYVSGEQGVKVGLLPCGGTSRHAWSTRHADGSRACGREQEERSRVVILQSADMAPSWLERKLGALLPCQTAARKHCLRCINTYLWRYSQLHKS
jgi:hypothetical protein